MAPASQTGMNKRCTHKNAYSPSLSCMHVQHKHRGTAWHEIWANLSISLACDSGCNWWSYLLSIDLLIAFTGSHVVILFIKCQKTYEKCSAQFSRAQRDLSSDFLLLQQILTSKYLQIFDTFASFLSTLSDSCSYNLKIDIPLCHGPRGFSLHISSFMLKASSWVSFFFPLPVFVYFSLFFFVHMCYPSESFLWI